MKINNDIFLNYGKIYIPPSSSEESGSPEYVATVLKNIENTGFTLSPRAIKGISDLTKNELENFYNFFIESLNKNIGNHREFNPMYPNFPEQVMEASDAELYINAIMHYLGSAFGYSILPQYEKAERLPLDEDLKLHVIDRGSEKDFKEIFTNLMSSKTSISAKDVENLKWFIVNNKSEVEFPEEIPHKEIMSVVACTCIENDINCKSFVKTATDVLRIATALSDGDASLAELCKFKKFSRKHRRMLLDMIDNLNGLPIEDMVKYKYRWIRLGEILHPGEYKNRYQNAFRLFNSLRNEKIKTFYGHLENSLAQSNVRDSVALLSEKPGVFARKLDFLLRMKETSQAFVLENFETVAVKVSSTVLWQVLSHFKSRNTKEFRSFIPKGQVAKMQVVKNELPEINQKICNKVVSICEKALKHQYSLLPEMGNVYLDQELSNYLIPFSQRSASNAMRTVVAGSKLPLGDKNIVRFFVWWRNLEECDNYNVCVDVDLSASTYDENWEYTGQVSWTNLKDSYAVHSGDITNAPEGACEFIDLNLSKLSKNQRYVIMSVYSYNGQPFSVMPECFAGWMTRSKMGKEGEIYDPKTVQNKYDITCENKTSVPLIIDTVEKQVIWMDMSCSARTIHNSSEQISNMGKIFSNLNKSNLFDLFTAHIEARNGNLVETPEEADVVFSVDDGIKPFDVEKIIGEYL